MNTQSSSVIPQRNSNKLLYMQIMIPNYLQIRKKFIYKDFWTKWLLNAKEALNKLDAIKRLL